MNFALVVCTYMRPKALQNLLISVNNQSLYPNEIIIVDGSLNHDTKNLLKNNNFKNLRYVLVDQAHRGLTRQRNYSIKMLSGAVDVVCFLDDDIVLEANYFKNLLHTYNVEKDALAVGGYIINEVKWHKGKEILNPNTFNFDGWSRTEPSRFKLRRKLGLQPDTPPGYLPTFAHGRSIGFLPPSGKIYRVEQIMGGVASYKKEVFNTLQFSTYFEGYGLYEDADFSLRLAKIGALFVNTSAQLKHYHEDRGRPNKYKYGKMVVRNGWYVWRVKYANPTLKMRLKWHATVTLLTTIRLSNAITSNNKNEAFSESLGRIVGWFSLILNKPKIN
ncbi:glycosyltransferase family 2 protein [Algibacter pectinivorans]|uniref:Glycosyltransferase, GT2 family n=1 Tax=Algibacter pectinivorans TaxID=870482 RepID=A0A1I1NYV3_9FLAO|nr:glycosyltransferase family 2 protein [Algibacter pectinivorans]SFD02871.1 Glycosyltransferase, GT2 family [Algibacter pectinivorans]